MKMPKASIIIPCYNQGDLIDDAVDSVLQQTFKDIEIIIVNDGSTDQKTNEKLAGYNRPNTRIVTTENQGLAAARNNGIRVATGEYILPLDADDRIGPTYLEIAAKLLDTRPDLGIVYCRAWLFEAEETEWLLPEFSLKEMLLENLIFCSAVFRKADWEKVGGYDTEMVHGWEDYDFWLSIIEMGREVYRIPRILFYYRVSENSMVRSSSRIQKRDTFVKIFQKHKNLFTDNISIWIDELFDKHGSFYEARLAFRQGGEEIKRSDWTRKVDIGLCRLVFSLDDIQFDCRVIFYPADDYVALKGMKLILEIDGEHGAKISSYQSNADMIHGDHLFFSSPEPKIDIDLPEIGEWENHPADIKLVVEIEYLAFGKDCLPIAIQAHNDSIHAVRQHSDNDQFREELIQQTQEKKHKSIIERIKLTLNRKDKTHCHILKQSGLFDEEYYRRLNPETDFHKIDPLLHYIKFGWRAGSNPNELFNVKWYMKHNPDSAGTDPLLHYIEVGWRDNRDPNPYFSTSYYVGKYAEYIKDGTNPLAHYLHRGWREGMNPNAFFDSNGYLSQYPDVAKAGINPLTHYINAGIKEGCHYFRFFDIDYYIEDSPFAKSDPALQYINFGADEGRWPNRFFDPIYYRENYCETGKSLLEAFLHYDKIGSKKHYRPWALFDPEYYAKTYPEYSQKERYPLDHYRKIGIFRGLYPCNEVAKLENKPTISIITPVFNTDLLLLKKCINSVIYQAYPYWELCLVDDGSHNTRICQILDEYKNKDKRIKTLFLNQNRGISEASNAGSDIAIGEYIGFLDHDDELTLNALYEVVLAINTYNPDILYSDEGLINCNNSKSRYLDRFFKPNFNHELLMSHNYITHFLVAKKDLFRRVGGFSKIYDGAQDYDLTLKLTEHSQKIHRIDKAIYLWRAVETSTSINHTQKGYADAAGRKALESNLQSRGIEAVVYPGDLQYYYKVERKVISQPKVSLLFIKKDFTSGSINKIVDLVNRTNYSNIDSHCIVFSKLSEKKEHISNLLSPSLKIHYFHENYGIALALNQVVSKTIGEQLVFIGDAAIKINRSDWIEVLLGYSQDPVTGVVGGLVNYTDENIPKINALPDINNKSCQYYRDFFEMCSRHLNGLQCSQNVLALSTDYCMLKRSSFNSVGGFDARFFPNVMYDLDLCLRLRQSGLENVYTPYCEAVFGSRSVFPVSDKAAEQEKKSFQDRWRDQLILGDPYYNTNKIFDGKKIAKEEWLEWYAGLNTPQINKYLC